MGRVVLPFAMDAYFYQSLLCSVLPGSLLRARGLLLYAVIDWIHLTKSGQNDATDEFSFSPRQVGPPMKPKSQYRRHGLRDALGLCVIAAMSQMTLPSGMRLKGGLESCLARTKLSQTKNQKDSSGDSQQTKSSSAYETKKSDAKKQAKDSAQLRNRVRAISLIDGVLTNAAQISSFEYRIRVEIEAAILLWRPDHERSVSILKKTVKSIRDLLDDEQTLKNIDVTRTELQRIKFLAIRKVASLNPDLLKDLIPAATPGNSTTSISGEWTEEARGLMSVASDQLEKDPRGAARLAEQSLRLGLVDWTNFLDRLKKRDSGEAERLTAILIDRLRDSSITPIYLLNLSG